MRKALTVLVAAMLMLAITPAVLATPADGNGNMFVLEFDDVYFGNFECDDGTTFVDIHGDGWIKFHEFKGNGNRQTELFTVNIVATFSNEQGSFVYRDVGRDLVWIDSNGDEIRSLTGTPADANGQGFSLKGQMIFNETTGEIVSVHGLEAPTDFDQACAALAA